MSLQSTVMWSIKFSSAGVSALPIFVFLFLQCFPITSLAAAGQCNADDKTALLSIKAAFQNSDQSFASWTDATACCDWAGVQCDAASSGRVVGLRVYGDAHLSGALPDALGDLPSLTNLIFSDLPRLTGSIPSSLTRLSRLSTLILTNNTLSGSIPYYLSQITTLRFLDLSYNLLSGPIPPHLSYLKSLFTLRLAHNQLSGPIPVSFGSFDKKKPPELDLSNNHLAGDIPFQLGLPEWGRIDLSNNDLSGDASVLFGSEKGTTRINLSSNRLRFDLTQVTFPVNLVLLYLNRNDISGSIPAQVNQLNRLVVLNLSYNKLCGEIPAGAVTVKFGPEAYAGNACLCGPPLNACH
ncbi:Polygalacturonase inhibitor [Apostasia shenzhenica]|uniref:Polygalacturonase inhibitor n=1 Tax=Apostasia shenzhenica TaxID=1088818 RepID=A0A2I0A724_9ASPA|nr:Polygalacturonase inhibitor [Apostasia shenzhenica]